MLVRATLLSNNYINRCGDKDKLNFEDGVNILVGPNGSGKSSFLEAIMRTVNRADKIPLAKLIRDSEVPIIYHSSGLVAATPNVDGVADVGISNDKESHGEALMRYMRSLENILDPTTIIMDEPEIGLDYAAIAELARIIESKPTLQFIISTHSPLLQTISDSHIITFGEDTGYLKKGLRLCQRRLTRTLG